MRPGVGSSADSDGDDGPAYRAAIYARTSSPKQKSIPQQVRLCRDHCERAGYPVRFILREDGLSAKTLDRPKLARLYQLCEQQRIDVIVVWKLDRLVRSLRHLLNVYNYLEDHDLQLVSLTEQFDTSNAFGRFNFRNISSAAELERDLISERAVLGKLAQAQAGRWPTQRPPVGYRLDDERNLSIDPEQAELVREMFAWYIDGVPLTEISARLGRRGVTTITGRSYAPSTIHKVIQNRIYLGELELMGIRHDRPDLRLVTDETWARSEKRRGQRCTDSKAPDRRKEAIDSVFDAYLESLRMDADVAWEG